MLYFLIPFTIYGFIQFSTLWFKKVWNNPKSFGVVMTIGSLTTTWAIYTVIMIVNKFPTDIMPIYAMWTLFAPISMIVGIISSIKNQNRKYLTYSMG
jgi:hypothetical protein